jgi:acyl-CoA thioester hydrolase
MRNKARLSPAPGNGTFTIPARVYYEDTDAAGVVYYANYLGFEQRDMLNAHGIAFVVRSVQADYLAPARLDNLLNIVTSILDIGRASITFAQSVLREQELLFDSRISVACVDTARGRPVAIPAVIRTLLPESPDPK